MSRKRLRDSYTKEALNFFNHVVEDKPLLPFLVPLVFVAWAIERWLVPFSNWVPLAVAVWATIQYGRFQRQLLVEDLNKKWQRLVLDSLPITPLEPCQWLNKLLMEVWCNFIDPTLSIRFRSIVERRLKLRKPRFIERIELLDFSLGSCPPSLGLHGTHWSTSGDQRVMRMGFDWDTNDMSIMLLAKLAIGTARIIINSIHIKGDVLLMPILDGQAILYSFESPPDVRIGVAFGSGGSQTLPATELPGVSTWLNKLLTETLVKTMVEPRRRCHPLPSVDLRKIAVGAVLSVTVISASNLVGSSSINTKGSMPERQQNTTGNSPPLSSGSRTLQTFVEVEFGELTRRTDVCQGLNPRWDTTFNMFLHDNAGILRFHLYERGPSSVKYDYLTSCEIKVRYVADDSTIFWAIGPGSRVLAKHAEHCGREVEMAVPFEGINVGELTVKLVLREWQYSDGLNSINKSARVSSQQSLYGSSNFQSSTGTKLKITVVEGRNLIGKDRGGKCDPYVKLQYGKSLHKTRTIPHASNPVWSQKFEFDEIADGEYLKIRCYNADILGDENIGSARVNLEGLTEGSLRDVWVPLEKVNTGEVRLQIEAKKSDDSEGSKNGAMGSGKGWIELVLIEAKDLIAADLRGTSDPYVRVQYGNIKKRTKVIHKTLNPQWNQTLEFPDNGSPLVLHVKDHNAVLPTSNIGDCVVEYERLPPNQMADKWIPLQGVKNGEIHIQITRKAPELEKKSSLDSDISSFSKANQIYSQVKQLIRKLRSSVEDSDREGLLLALSEMDSAEDMQAEYMTQLEREKKLLLHKITKVDREIIGYSASASKKMYAS